MPSRLKHRRPFAPLVWAVLLLAAQAVVVAHLHDDAAPESVCVVCSLAKAQTAAAGDPAPPPAVPTRYLLPAAPDAPGGFPACTAGFQPRGPPPA